MGLFDGTPLQRSVTCEVCGKPLAECRCPRAADGRVLSPNQQTASIRIENRVGKTITLISNLDPRASDLSSLLKKLRESCASGGTVKDDIVELQGDHRQTAADVLHKIGFKTKVR
jgi:translation initiation factor 1